MDRNADVALTKNAGQGAEGAKAGVVERVYHHKSTVGAYSQPKRWHTGINDAAQWFSCCRLLATQIEHTQGLFISRESNSSLLLPEIGFPLEDSVIINMHL